MLDKRRKQKLELYMEKKKTNLSRHIYITHRYLSEWADKQWKADGWENIRHEHLRLISIIGTDVVNNNELAKRAGVTKQAMSKMVADLEKHGFIDVAPDPDDMRAKIISMSNSGVDFLEYFQNCSKNINKQFEIILGKEKVDNLVLLMSELTDGIMKEWDKEWHPKK